MQHANASQSYRQISTQTAPPGQLVLMLYDGALRFLEQARRAFSFDDPLEFNQTIHNGVTRAQNIINELNTALDLERGGDCAANFRRLYDYFDRRLHEANQYKKQEGIDEVIRRLTIIRDAWAEMLAKSPSGADTTSVETTSLSVAA